MVIGRTVTCSPIFLQLWADCHSNDLFSLRKKGFVISGNQILKDARLCIPEDRVEGVFMTLQVETGHPGIDSPGLAAKARYQFPPHTKITERVRLICSGCIVCQSCFSSHFLQEKTFRINLVIEGFGASTLFGYFSHPAVEWRDENFNCIFVVCGPRLELVFNQTHFEGGSNRGESITPPFR